MADLRSLAIKWAKLSGLVDELDNRVEILEGLVETLTVLLEEETPPPAAKRRPRKKAA